MNNFGYRRSVTLTILIINVIVFFLFRTILFYFIRLFALSPYEFFYKFYFWQPLTYMFIHGDFSHLFFNMFIFFQVGLLLETLWGPKKFLIFYILSGAITGILSISIYFLSGLKNILLIGASGAIYSLMVGFALTMPESIVNLYFIIPIKAKYTPFVFAALDIFFWLISSTGDIGNTRISHLGHLIGILIGFILYPLIVNKYVSYSDIFNIRRKRPFFKDNIEKNFNLHKKFKEEDNFSDYMLIQNSLYKIKNNIGFSQYEIEKLLELANKIKNEDRIICDEITFDPLDIKCLKCPKIALCILRYIKSKNLD